MTQWILAVNTSNFEEANKVTKLIAFVARLELHYTIRSRELPAAAPTKAEVKDK